jgi:hypothetical protein
VHGFVIFDAGEILLVAEDVEVARLEAQPLRRLVGAQGGAEPAREVLVATGIADECVVERGG